jgi:hypothetical protein
VPTFSLIILVFDGKRGEFIEGKTSPKRLSPASVILLSVTPRMHASSYIRGFIWAVAKKWDVSVTRLCQSRHEQ